MDIVDLVWSYHVYLGRIFFQQSESVEIFAFYFLVFHGHTVEDVKGFLPVLPCEYVLMESFYWLSEIIIWVL